jgi:hypothetical protein
MNNASVVDPALRDHRNREKFTLRHRIHAERRTL